MTREEEIKKQAERYTDDASNYTEWSDDGGWSDTNDVELVEKAFIEGAKWADNHPVNVWHDASEEPKGTYIVLCDGLDNRQWVVDYLHIDMSYDNWQDYADAISVCRWAYTSDLLPKGGER